MQKINASDPAVSRTASVDPTRRHSRRSAAAVTAVALMLLMCACTSPAEPPTALEDASGPPAGRSPSATPSPSAPPGSPADDAIEIGFVAWDEDIAVSNLWAVLLEERGYAVELIEMNVEDVFGAVADGSIDVFMDAWLPATHATYWDAYGDQVDDLGSWFESAPLTWAVPAFVDDVDSIADLRGAGERFGNRIIGIEPDSGLMRISREQVLPAYRLTEEYDLLAGSTPDMLTELTLAFDRRSPIVVTLWEPHWAYAEFPLRNLGDPREALGEPDAIHTIARQGFADDFPDVHTALRRFSLDSDTVAGLENRILNGGTAQERTAVEAWLADGDHRAMTDRWWSDEAGSGG